MLLCCLQMLIPEMQKLFASKNETNMLKLWPLFVRLLGKVRCSKLPNTALESLNFSVLNVEIVSVDKDVFLSLFSCSTKAVLLLIPCCI